jgi:hypothetical protein
MQDDKGFFLENDKNREIPIKDCTGKTLHLKLEGRAARKGKPKEKRHFRITKVVWKRQSDVQDKIILIEEIQFLENSKKVLRFGYWTQTHKEGKWWWGQSALFVPTNDLKELLQLAKEKGLID